MHVMAKGQPPTPSWNHHHGSNGDRCHRPTSLQEGEVVTLLGQGENDQIGPEIWSEACGTIPWEILAALITPTAAALQPGALISCKYRWRGG